MGSKRKLVESGRTFADEMGDVDPIVYSLNKAWSDDGNRLAYMLQAIVYAIRENTAKLEELRKVLASYD